MTTWLQVFNEDITVVSAAYYSIKRRKQMESLAQYDESERPDPHELDGYIRTCPEWPNYYEYRNSTMDEPRDFFFELSDWLADASYKKRAEMEDQKKRSQGPRAMPTGAPPGRHKTTLRPPQP